MKHLLTEEQMVREVPFMGGFIDVRKTTIRNLKDVQEATKDINFEEDTEESMQFVYDTLRRFVVGAEDMTAEDFEEFPIEELSALIEEIIGKKAGNP